MLNKYIVKYNGELGRIYPQKDDTYIFKPMGAKYYNSSTDPRHPLAAFEETTAEEQLSYLKRTFVWGKIRQIHEIGDILIFEHNSNVKGKEDEINFHVYINYADTSTAATSLDKAIILALTLKYDGPNSQAGIFFERMLQMDKEETNEK